MIVGSPNLYKAANDVRVAIAAENITINFSCVKRNGLAPSSMIKIYEKAKKLPRFRNLNVVASSLCLRAADLNMDT